MKKKDIFPHFRSIGMISSPHRDKEKTPIQPCFADEFTAEVTVFPEFADGLMDIEGFSHIYLIYVFHKCPAPKLIIKPYLEDVEHGVFASRTPCRPNPIGLSIVRLLERKDNILRVSGADMLDGTPLLDIKPYTAMFDRIDGTKNGWQDGINKELANKIGRRK